MISNLNIQPDIKLSVKQSFGIERESFKEISQKTSFVLKFWMQRSK